MKEAVGGHRLTEAKVAGATEVEKAQAKMEGTLAVLTNKGG